MGCFASAERPPRQEEPFKPGRHFRPMRAWLYTRHALCKQHYEHGHCALSFCCCEICAQRPCARCSTNPCASLD